MSTLPPRIDYPDFARQAPAVHSALRAMSKAVDDSGLEKSLTELIKLRASQINGCAFCLQFHLNVLRKLGVEAPRLDLVAAWRDAGVFSARQAAALEWTETLTLMAQRHTDDAAWQALRLHFSESEAMNLTVAIGTINQWNRIAVALRFAPPIAEGSAA
ncbi:alkylhydroperoxidase AhpD family core domain protein [Variovorax sp. SRS16]|uniref:carboxymuconolactone decarboxylase family protein n=1 Tax=Variovorax sp. SRS16 TaxID=282217 RepID=UPI001317C6B9|nr:carboxymuconolactone decarboxylase family protein [Variovorax sp. SRS16]VTU21325.1 alkylhydroperoxidase AhpD family core domain protein [Variovorax sp. SRS16]